MLSSVILMRKKDSCVLLLLIGFPLISAGGLPPALSAASLLNLMGSWVPVHMFRRNLSFCQSSSNVSRLELHYLDLLLPLSAELYLFLVFWYCISVFASDGTGEAGFALFDRVTGLQQL
jgi:hypothetical protein